MNDDKTWVDEKRGLEWMLEVSGRNA